MTKPPDITFVGAFRTYEDDELLQTYTASVTANVSKKAPKGFKEFFLAVKEINPLTLGGDLYTQSGHEWDGDNYTDVFDVIQDYPEYFKVISVESQDLDEKVIEKVNLDDLSNVIFYS